MGGVRKHKDCTIGKCSDLEFQSKRRWDSRMLFAAQFDIYLKIFTCKYLLKRSKFFGKAVCNVKFFCLSVRLTAKSNLASMTSYSLYTRLTLRLEAISYGWNFENSGNDRWRLRHPTANRGVVESLNKHVLREKKISQPHLP